MTRTRSHPPGGVVASHPGADAGVALVSVRLPWLAAVAVALQLTAGLPWFRAEALTPSMVMASHVLVAVWFAANAVLSHGLLRYAMGIAALGWMLNLAVMLPNGGMPVSHATLVSIGAADADVTVGQLSKHVPLTDETVLPALADVHPLRPLGMVYSAGDVVLALGLLAAVGVIGLEQRASGAPQDAVGVGRRQLQTAVTDVQ